jgi:hypothetical protein
MLLSRHYFQHYSIDQKVLSGETSVSEYIVAQNVSQASMKK